MFERLESIIPKEKIELLKNKKIMVIGLGGVGGYVVESLVRSGITNLIIIDKDIVDITNKNRQIIALDSTLGRTKVEVFKERIKDINKECNVILINTYDIIDKYHPDYLIDACDTITTKIEIIKACKELDINFISSMGTGNKLDPSKLLISDIKKTHTDPLAKVIRKLLRENNIKGKVDVLWSSELPIKNNNRTPGSTSFVPSSAGILIASYVFKKIIDDDIIK